MRTLPSEDMAVLVSRSPWVDVLGELRTDMNAHARAWHVWMSKIGGPPAVGSALILGTQQRPQALGNSHCWALSWRAASDQKQLTF